MKKSGVRAKQIAAMLLSGILIAGSVSGPVFASDFQEDPGQTSEIAFEAAENGITEEAAVEAAENAVFEEEAAGEAVAGDMETDPGQEAETGEEAEAGQTPESAVEAAENAVSEEEAAGEAVAEGTETDPGQGAENGEETEAGQTAGNTPEDDPAEGSSVENSQDNPDSPEEEGNPVSAPASGSCGENLSWTFDEEGLLTISGTGDMTEITYGAYKEYVKSIAIEDGVTGICDQAFQYCYSVSSVSIAESVLSIGEDAFCECINLDEVILPDNLQRIGAGAFCSCNSLVRLTIPRGVSDLGNGVSYGCDSLEEVILSEGLTCIEEEAFTDCRLLKSVTIPASVTHIKDGAFYLCKSLSDVYYGGSKDQWIAITFDDHNSSLQDANIHFHDGEVLTSHPSCGKNLDWTLSDGVLKIFGNGSMKDFDWGESPWIYRNVRSVVIEEGVTSIGDLSFYDCDNLTDVTIPESVAGIGLYAFFDCDSLSEVTIPGGVRNIQKFAFSGCDSLVNVTVSDSAISISEEAFGWNRNLENVSISRDGLVENIEAFLNTPWIGSVMNRELALTIYDRFLEDREGEFCLLFISDDDIPDLVFRDAPSSYMIYVNGSEVTGFQSDNLWDGEGDEPTLGFTCFPYKSLFKICEDDNYPCYYRYESVNGLSECYKCLEHKGDFYYNSYLSESEEGQERIDILDRWVCSTEITQGEFESLLTQYSDGETETECGFLENTEENRADAVSGLIRIENAVVKNIVSKTYTGKALLQVPVVVLGGKTLEEGVDYEVSYSDNLNAGTAYVTITGRGYYSGSQSAAFKIEKTIQSIKASNLSLTFPKTGKINASGNIGKLSYRSDNSSVAVVNASGLVTPKGAGTAKITIIAAETSNYKKAAKTVKVTVGKGAQTITAKASRPVVAVGRVTEVQTSGAKGSKSYKSSDSSVARVMSDGSVVGRKVGTVKIKVTAGATAGYESASDTVTIKVVPAAPESLSCSNQATGIKLKWSQVAGANGYKIYRGSTLVKTITSGKTVTYTDTKANSNCSKYTFKIVAKASTGDSTLSKSCTTYRVAAPSISSVANSSASSMTVKWGKNTKASGYQIKYSTSGTFESGNKSLTVYGGATASKAIFSLKKGKKYYVIVRAFKTAGGVQFWSAWSPVKSVKISK